MWGEWTVQAYLSNNNSIICIYIYIYMFHVYMYIMNYWYNISLQVQRPSLTRSLVEGLVLRGRQVPTQNHAFFSKACKSSPRPRSSHIGPAKKRHQSHQKLSEELARTSFQKNTCPSNAFLRSFEPANKGFQWIAFMNLMDLMWPSSCFLLEFHKSQAKTDAKLNGISPQPGNFDQEFLHETSTNSGGNFLDHSNWVFFGETVPVPAVHS